MTEEFSDSDEESLDDIPMSEEDRRTAVNIEIWKAMGERMGTYEFELKYPNWEELEGYRAVNESGLFYPMEPLPPTRLASFKREVEGTRGYKIQVYISGDHRGKYSPHVIMTTDELIVIHSNANLARVLSAVNDVFQYGWGFDIDWAACKAEIVLVK